ncbi:SLC13 family permease [Streptococcus halichoeri]|uniref:SLC13 family permease n=1 Tax=Streptococcus halichoeri TaxID=254785 RepID=UPI001F28FA12|nr:SLC13 family permease [Streptococcus halichoeri]
MLIQFVIIIAIFLSIAIGYWKKINVGLIAIAFAYLIGAGVLKVAPKDLIDMWPTQLFFTILAVSLFYNFAITNGTLTYLAQLVLYKTQSYSQGIYLILYFLAMGIAAAGAGFFTTMVICCPLAVSLCKQSRKSILLTTQVVNLGAAGGANFMTSGSGLVFQGLFKELGWGKEALSFGLSIFLFTILYPLLFLLLAYAINKFFYRQTNQSAWVIEKPAALTHKQKQTLGLMGMMMALVLVLPNLSLLFPGIDTLTAVTRMADIGLICIVLSVLAFLLNLSDQKRVFSQLPWNTLIMLSGMGMLIKLATQFGLIETVANGMRQTLPPQLLPLAFAFVAGILSLFSSTLSVVAPTLFPVATAISQAHPHIQAHVLFVAIVAGALSTNISPFSAAGSLIQASIPEQEERDSVFKQQLMYGMPLTFAIALLAVLIYSLMVGGS